MTEKSEAVTLIPSARRLIKSLRDMGYDFNQAVADLIDNSIEAEATNIEITLTFDGDDSRVEIIDNGLGMTRLKLAEAMRYGSERDYSDSDLGKFGLGMKTASMSQCKCLTVATKHRGESKRYSGYQWDLDHIEKTNRWEILPVHFEKLPLPVQRKLLDQISGTAVIWDKLDRILGYKHPYGHHARKQLSTMCRELENHLSMVFHNFISPDDDRQSVVISVNGNVLKAWDPFCRDEPNTQILDPEVIDVNVDGARGQIVLLPYILPNKESFSSVETWERSGGPSDWNQQQGFYIYRAGRMIQAGGWSRLFALDEHMKLARIAVLFDPNLDDAFKVNVAKMRVQLPSSVRGEIKDCMRPVRKLARSIYDKKALPECSGSFEKPGGNGVSAKGQGLGSSRLSANTSSVLSLSIADFEALLLEHSRPTEKPIIKRVIARVSEKVSKHGG